MNLLTYAILKYGKKLKYLLDIVFYGTIIISLTFIKWPIYVNLILVIIYALFTKSPTANLIPTVLMIIALFKVIKSPLQPLTIVYFVFFAVQVLIYISPFIKINKDFDK